MSESRSNTICVVVERPDQGCVDDIVCVDKVSINIMYEQTMDVWRFLQTSMEQMDRQSN